MMVSCRSWLPQSGAPASLMLAGSPTPTPQVSNRYLSRPNATCAVVQQRRQGGCLWGQLWRGEGWQRAGLEAPHHRAINLALLSDWAAEHMTRQEMCLGSGPRSSPPPPPPLLPPMPHFHSGAAVWAGRAGKQGRPAPAGC
jgi:hypothetical protein